MLKNALLEYYSEHKESIFKAPLDILPVACYTMKEEVMAKFPVFLFLMLCLAISVPRAEEIAVDPAAPAYHNARFGFSLSWTPGNYTVSEAENGDGITVTDGKGLTMLAYAALDPRVGDVTREDFFTRANRTKAAYRRVNRQEGWYVLSYVENGNIVYIKQFYSEDHWPTLRFEYPQSMKQQYDQLVTKAVSTFQPFLCDGECLP